MPSSTPPIRPADSDIYDVIIIGGGPSALAVAARLREPLPSALYTDVEHQRFQWLKRHGPQVRTRDHRSLKSRDTSKPIETELRILVLDKSGDEFLSAWKTLFKAFDISHLRSPMFFHPDPQDVDSLLAYACLEKRDGELMEISGVVGKERSKHQEKWKRSNLLPKNDVNERDRQNYFTLSSKIFIDFCQDVISRYRLQSLTRKVDITLVEHARLHVKGTTVSSDPGFCITTATFGARAQSS